MYILPHAIYIASNTIPPKSNKYRDKAVNAVTRIPKKVLWNLADVIKSPD